MVMENFFDIVKTRDIIFSARPLIDVSHKDLMALNQKAAQMLDLADKEEHPISAEALRATGANIIVDTVNELALRN